MNARYLCFILVVMVVGGLAMRTRSTLTPERGVDHVFYGGYNDFLAQEVLVTDLDNDGKDDVVTTLLWDQQGGCDADPQKFNSGFACDPSHNYTRWIAEKGVQDTVICGFPDSILAERQRAYWEDEC